MARPSGLVGYRSWCGVASYFDGDGTVEVQLGKYTLRFRLSFTDNWRLQVEQIKRFLESQGVRCERIAYARGAYHLVVGHIASIRVAAREMIASGCVYRKKRELTVLLRYYDDKLCGDQVVGEFNHCVRIGLRSGYERKSHLPLTYRGGRRLQARLTGMEAGRVLQKIDSALVAAMTHERTHLGMSVKEIASIHRLSKTTVSRVLRKSFGVSRLGRVGDQETLD